MKLRPHQIEKSKELLKILQKYNCVYLRGMVRSGKTITALETARLFGAIKVLILTRKKAIDSIISDYEKMNYQYYLLVTNYESVHKVDNIDFDLVIYDEAHSLSAYAKPAKRVKEIKKRFSNIPCIWMTGTSAVESYSQYYHQFFVSDYSPFKQYRNFYHWSKVFVNVKQKRLSTHVINDYSDAKVQEIDEIIMPLTVVMTQQDAGIETKINEHFIRVDLPDRIKKIADKLIKDRAVQGSSGYIMGETPAKLQSKLHQIYSGSVIVEKEDGASEAITLDTFKVEAIRVYFKGLKIAVAYYYQQELEMLKNVFGDSITSDLDEFNTTDKNFAIQQSSSEGMNLSKAECLVFLNWGFSGKNWVQARDRMTVRSRLTNDIYLVFEKEGISEKIYKAVNQKKSYNIRSFKADYKI